MGVKSVGMIAGQNIPTIISPQNYKMRSYTNHTQHNTTQHNRTWQREKRVTNRNAFWVSLSFPSLRFPRLFRFRLAMERYFMVSPDHSSRLTLLSNSAANDANEKEGK